MNIYFSKKWLMLLHIPLLTIVLLSVACADVISEAVSSVENLAAVVLNQVDPQLRDGALLLDWDDPNDDDFSEVEIIATPKDGGKAVKAKVPRGFNINRKDAAVPEGYRYRLGGLESGKKYKIEIVAYGRNNKKSTTVKSEYIEIDEDKTAPDDDLPVEELQIVPVEGTTDKMKAVWDPEKINFDVARIKMIIYKADSSAEILEEIDIEDLSTGEQEFTKPAVKFKVSFLLIDNDGNMQESTRLDDVKNNFEVDPDIDVNLAVVAGLKTTTAQGRVTISWDSPQISSTSTEWIIVKIFDLTHERELAYITVDAETIGTSYGFDIAANGKSVSIDSAMIGKSKFKVRAQVQKNGMLFDPQEIAEDQIEDASYAAPPEVMELGAKVYKTSILVHWKEPKEPKDQAGQFEEYVNLDYWGVEITLKEGDTVVEGKLVSRGKEKVLFEGLSPATAYTIEAISLGLTSEKQSSLVSETVTTLAQDAREPTTTDPVADVEAEGYYGDDGKLNVKLSWENPESSDLSGVLLTVKKSGTALPGWDGYEIESYERENYHVFDLERGTTYNFELTATYGEKKSTVVSKTYTSAGKPAITEAVTDLIESVIASTGKQEIIVTFNNPVQESDGIFYTVVVYEKTSGNWLTEHYLEFGQRTIVINNAYDKFLTLEPGKSYVVKLMRHDERGLETEEKQIGEVSIDANAEKVEKIVDSGKGIDIGQATAPGAATDLAASAVGSAIATITFNSPTSWGLGIEGQALTKNDVMAVVLASSVAPSATDIDGSAYVLELLKDDYAASFGGSGGLTPGSAEMPFVDGVVIGMPNAPLADSAAPNTVRLSGLAAGTEYHYVVVLGHPVRGIMPTVSSIGTFTTSGASAN